MPPSPRRTPRPLSPPSSTEPNLASLSSLPGLPLRRRPPQTPSPRRPHRRPSRSAPAPASLSSLPTGDRPRRSPSAARDQAVVASWRLWKMEGTATRRWTHPPGPLPRRSEPALALRLTLRSSIRAISQLALRRTWCSPKGSRTRRLNCMSLPWWQRVFPVQCDAHFSLLLHMNCIISNQGKREM